MDVQERTEDSQEVGDGNAQGDITQESIESEADTETQSQEKIVDGEVGNIFTGNRGTEVIIKKTKNLTITESKSETVDPNAQKKFGLKGTTKIYQQVYGDRMNGTDPVPMLHIYPNTSIITGKKITQDQIQTQEEIDTESRDLESFLNDNDVVVEETEALQTDETVVEAVTPDTDGNLKIIESIKGSQVTLPGQKVNNTLSITDKTTTENDSYYSSDKFTQQNPNTTVEKHESKILKLANKAVKAIAKILPNTKIVIHRSEAAYNKFVTGKGTKGTFDPNTNTIHINMPKANAKTIAHEIFHAVLYDRFGSDIKIAEVTKRMFDAVNRKITDKKLKKELQDFSDRYSEFQNEEYLSELVGILADNYPSLSTPEKSIIKRWLVKLGSMIGISPEIDTDADVLNLLDTIGKSVKEGKEITSADIKQLDMFEGGQQVDNPSTALKNQKIGDFEITYTEDKKIADYIKEELITEPKNILDVFKGLDISNVEVLIHSPDDMLAGEIKYKGETIFEGSGGVFFVTKFKEVWASTEDAANQIVKGLNKQIDEQGKAFMLLAKGTDQKLMSSAGGVDGAMKILDLMLDNKIFSASEFRAAVSKAISQEQSRLTTKAKKDKKPAPKFKPFKLRKSAKDIKNDIVKLFSDESSGTFETRGNIVKGIGNALASAKLNPEQQSRAAEFLGGDTTRRVGVSSTVQKKTGKALSQGLSDLIALVLAENLTKGLKTGDIYAVIEVNQKVKPEKSTHPSYNTTIVTEDGKPPVLHLLKNRQPGKEVLTPNFGEYNNSPYKPGQVPTMTGQINLDKTTVADREQKTTKQRQQKAGVDKLAKMYNMESNGVILAKPGIDRVALEEWANSLGFKIKTTKGDRGQTTSYQLMKNGKRYKPGDEKKSQRQQVSDVLNKDMSAVEIINVARANNFRGPAIKDYLVRVKKMKVKEVNALLKVPLTMFSSIPEAFTNIKEGMNEGVKFYTDILKKTVTWQIKNKATDAQAFDKAVQLLEESKIFQNQADKNKKSLSTLQKEMIVGMQKSLGIRPMKNTNLKLRVLRQSLKDTKRGAKELKSVQSKLRNFIRRSLPKKLYTKGEITTLISDVTNATEANIDNLIQKVIDKITTIQVADLESTIEKLMDDNYEKTESGREKGKKIIVDVNDRLKALKKDMVTDSMVADDVVKRNLELNQEFNEITNKSEQLSEGDLNRLIDLAVLINLNNATLMNNTDVNKVESLNKAAELLTQIVGKGKELFKAQLKKDHQKYLKNKETLYEQVTGEKIDMSDPDQVAKAKKAETKGKARKNKRESDGLLKKSVRGLQLAMSSFFKGSESLSGLMNIIDRLPGELIGGKVREMVYGLLNESTRVYKARKKGNKQIIEAKLKEIFGKKWKSGISAMRKPIDWSATKDIFIDEKEVNEAKKLVEENPTRENKKNLKKVIAENTIVMSQDEILYQYQQFQDPANLASFMNENNFLYRGDPKRILESLMEQVDPKNKEVADWMVEEFYPSLYEHYNKTYKAIYRTNLPWNDKYAGRIYREASAPNPLDLLGTDVKSNNQVSAASTKVRRMNDKPIVKMGMMDVMMTYTTDMEWFASHAEAIRDINKMFDDPLIAQAIEQNNGEGTLLLIRDSIQKIARRGINNAARGKFMNAVNNMFIAARLGANPTIFLKQMTSFITYANDIGIVNYMKYAAINKTEALKVYKEIWNNSVYVQDRASERIQDVLESYTSLGNVEFSTKENYITKLMMSPVKYGDLGAIFLGGSPNYSFYKAQAIKAGKTEAQAIEIAIRKFENDTKNTQQSSDLQDKDYYQTADPVVRAFNMFLTTPKQYLRKEFGAIRNLYRKLAAWDRKAGQGTVVQNVRQLAMYHFVMPLFFQFVAMGFPDLGDLEDEEKEDLLRAGILGNFNALFIAGDVLTMIADAVQEKPWAGTTKSLAPLNVMSEIANLYTRAEKTKDPVKRAELTQKMMLRITEVALTPTGKNLPLVNIAKYVKNLNELGEGGSEKDFMRLFNYSKYVIDKEGKDKGTKLSKKEMQLYFPDLYEQEMALDKELKALDKELELELDF